MKLALALLLTALTLPLTAQDVKFYGPAPTEDRFTKHTVTFLTAGDLKADIYRPRPATGKLPVLLFFNGVGQKLGSGLFRDHPQYAGWGRAATTVGLVGVVMESDQSDSRKSFDSLLAYLRQHADELGVDPEQMIVWSCSANAKVGTAIVTDPQLTNVRGGIIYYGNGNVGSYRSDEPVLVVRAGLDSEGLNRGLDSIAAAAIKSNAPWSVVNYSGGRHGFDIFDDTPQTRSIIDQTLAFARLAVSREAQASLASHQKMAQAAGFAYAEQWPQAEAAYRALLTDNPSDNMSHWKLAQILAGENKHGEAIRHFQRALELGNPNRGWISITAAKSAMAIGDRQLALKLLEGLRGINVMIEQMKTAPEFASLRDDPKFKEIAASK
jgi:tetratricopeptide (TPR) repeat protein